MDDPQDSPGIGRLQRAIAEGDLSLARKEVLQLDDKEQEKFSQELGRQASARLFKAARSLRRGVKSGRVVVLHGVMGSLLDSVNSRGDSDRIWINLLRLCGGRIEELELDPAGEPAKAGYQVRIAGPDRKTYVPLLFELDQHWQVRPFCYDWREDINRSAIRLAGEIRAWAGGEPVHLVAHSMGGLVARRFIGLFAELWSSMRDPNGAQKGGRLVMLGTPNYGSFAAPLALSGAERLVKMLAALDQSHNLPEILTILNSFPGSYQMLPSPYVNLDDDHDRLFDLKTWGKLPVRQPLLDLARRFHTEIRDIVDPERFIYVAGYDRPTPFRIRVDGPGSFSYRETLDGDGRVPHQLGLLPKVPTFWVDEIHGNLAKNERVLDGIHDLLLSGTTDALAPNRPARRGEVPDEWKGLEELEKLPQEFLGILPAAGRAAIQLHLRLDPVQAVRLESLIAGDYLATHSEPAEKPVVVHPDTPRTGRKGRLRSEAPSLEIEVVWGDITAVDADAYAVGHYEGVLPQNAEKGLDNAISGGRNVRPQILTDHSKRGILRGSLGDIDYYPWNDPEHPGRIVVIAGMGRPGSFGSAALRRLIRDLTWSVASLPCVATVSTVLIGSGAGTLTVKEAMRGLLFGISDALAAGKTQTRIRRLLIVERMRNRAAEILAALKEEVKRNVAPRSMSFRVRPEMRSGLGGEVSDEDALGLLLGALSHSAAAAGNSKIRKAVSLVAGELPSEGGVRETVYGALGRVGMNAPKGAEGIASRLEVRIDHKDIPSDEIPSRLSFVRDGNAIRAAAITRSATVSERVLSFDIKLLDEIVDRMTDPDPAAVADLSDFLTHLIVPREFRKILQEDGPFVFEVDRYTARLHWEMLSGGPGPDNGIQAISLRTPLARQLRTTYSPSPSSEARFDRTIRALVVGDPGDPSKNANLPGAQTEALRVFHKLKQKGIEVQAMIGAPNIPRRGDLLGIAPAQRSEVLRLLMRGGIDILHYSGHGFFKPEDPSGTGWVFSEGLLTARELGRIDEAPRLIVANACLSSRTSTALEHKGRAGEPVSDAGLLPSLADEFFLLGVRNYIGTAWSVNDLGAVLFAEKLYDTLIPDSPEKEWATVGKAVLEARSALFARRRSYGSLWAAYQHYGDPDYRLKDAL